MPLRVLDSLRSVKLKKQCASVGLFRFLRVRNSAPVPLNASTVVLSKCSQCLYDLNEPGDVISAGFWDDTSGIWFSKESAFKRECVH